MPRVHLVYLIKKHIVNRHHNEFSVSLRDIQTLKSREFTEALSMQERTIVDSIVRDDTFVVFSY
jgi:hypothetical protein